MKLYGSYREADTLDAFVWRTTGHRRICGVLVPVTWRRMLMVIVYVSSRRLETSLVYRRRADSVKAWSKRQERLRGVS